MADRKRRALSGRGGRLTSSGDPALVEVLRRACARAATEPADTLTHGFHTWPARMHPAIAAELITTRSAPGSTVVDPFCGGGTTLVEAVAAGRVARGSDLNPLAVRVATVRTAIVDAAGRAAISAGATQAAEESRRRVKERDPVRAPLSSKHVRLYQPHVLKELAGLWASIAALEDEAVRRPLIMVFSSLAVKFSKQRSETDDRLVDKRIGRFVPTGFFERKTNELVERWAELQRATPPGGRAPKLKTLDVRDLPQTRWRADLIVTSPPYGGTYDYEQHHLLRMAWLGMDARTLARGEVGARRRLSAPRIDADAALQQWDDELRECLRSMAAILEPDGEIVVELGDGEVAGRRVPADKQLARLAPEVGLAVAAVCSEERTDFRGGKPKKEHLVVLRRAGVPGNAAATS